MPTSLHPIRQSLVTTHIGDVSQAVAAAWAASPMRQRLKPGQHVALLVGSRGIHRLPELVAAMVRCCTDAGALPFLVPAMGSHGGATGPGQAAMLASLGVTEATAGCPIVASMETRLLGASSLGIPVHVDAAAWEADWILPINRIKPHTKFNGPLESGLCKMLAVGLGKEAGATVFHQHTYQHGMYACIQDMARHLLASGTILGGLGVVENGAGELGELALLPPGTLEADEARLLTQAKDWMPRIPFEAIDLLIVEAIGKDISGTGMDTNVIGRNRDLLGSWDLPPHPKRIVVLSLTPATRGNAVGLGYADFTTQAVLDALDRTATYTNAMAGISPEKAALPMALPTDREAIAAALASLGHWHPETVRVVRITDTKHLETMWVSKALYERCGEPFL